MDSSNIWVLYASTFDIQNDKDKIDGVFSSLVSEENYNKKVLPVSQYKEFWEKMGITLSSDQIERSLLMFDESNGVVDFWDMINTIASVKENTLNKDK